MNRDSRRRACCAAFPSTILGHRTSRALLVDEGGRSARTRSHARDRARQFDASASHAVRRRSLEVGEVGSLRPAIPVNPKDTGCHGKVASPGGERMHMMAASRTWPDARGTLTTTKLPSSWGDPLRHGRDPEASAAAQDDPQEAMRRSPVGPAALAGRSPNGPDRPRRPWGPRAGKKWRRRVTRLRHLRRRPTSRWLPQPRSAACSRPSSA